MNGSRSASETPANARRTGNPSPSKPLGAVVTERTGRSRTVRESGSDSLGRASMSSTVIAGMKRLLCSAQRAVNRAQQSKQAELLRRGKGRELLGDQLLVGRHRRFIEAPPARSEVEPVGAPGRPSLDQSRPLHPVQQLADVALSYQERVGDLLLARALGCPDLGQHVELRQAQPEFAKLLLRGLSHLLEHPCQPQPGQHSRAGSARSHSLMLVYLHYCSLLNL